MSRFVHRPIAVLSWQADEPMSFTDGQVSHEIVAVIDRWLEMGDWWSGEGVRKMLRVWTRASCLFDLEGAAGQWWIYRVWD